MIETRKFEFNGTSGVWRLFMCAKGCIKKYVSSGAQANMKEIEKEKILESGS